ncbi:MAG: hypothetical protein ACE5KV_03685 [Thermoplasmata archaeon]
MKRVEFVVHGLVPPRNVGKQSMWNDDTEVPRVIELRKRALESIGDRQPLSEDIRLTIEIHIPKSHNEPGDLDNFIKGICDSLYVPRKSLDNPNFSFHELFDLPENRNVHPERFAIIKDNGQIAEIHARLDTKESDNLYYRVTVWGK